MEKKRNVLLQKKTGRSGLSVMEKMADLCRLIRGKDTDEYKKIKEKLLGYGSAFIAEKTSTNSRNKAEGKVRSINDIL